MKKKFAIAIIVVLIVILCLIIYFAVKQNSSNNTNSLNFGRTQFGGTESPVTVTSSKNSDGTYNLKFDNSKWNYDSSNDIYYQIGVVYCASPETTDYETLGIYVPGKYFTGNKNSDDTYTVSINSNGKVGDYTSTTAPIVMPINTGGYAAQHSPSSYSASGIATYTNAGLIYVYAGCRGRNDGETAYSTGAPWGVTDLKAAVRFVRYNAKLLPGNTENIFSFGHSGGGAQSSILGASGNSELYTPYLSSIGALMQDDSKNSISDAITGAMCWCPITNLDTADEAYEWNMGQYVTTGTREDGTFTKSLSNDMAKEFATYINTLGLKTNETELKLEESNNGIYTSGTYYDYIKSVIETSLNNFLSDTTFPYTPSTTTMADGGFGGGAPNKSSNTSTSSKTYQTIQDYINSLNSDIIWINYDSVANKATITNIGEFVTHCKSASKDVGAFDSLSKSQAENKVFGNSNSSTLHFDRIMAKLLNSNNAKYSSLANWNSSYPTDYSNDLTSTDKMGKDVAYRANMYNPMYYISKYYNGYGKSDVAKYWRIRTGINQGDTALTTETNLYLALSQYLKDKSTQQPASGSVDFATVWGQAHTTAERTGDSSSNFISWVKQCATQTIQ